MSELPFDPHAKILRNGQYVIKKNQNIPVPILSFDENATEEARLIERITELNTEINLLEQELNSKEKSAQERVDKIIFHAQDEAKKILEEAEQHAFDKVQQSVKDKEVLLQQAQEEADRIISKAEQSGSEIKTQATFESSNIKEDARQSGQQTGYEQGLLDGARDVSVVVERLHAIVAETARERERILEHSETQVINLVLTMVHKVVKQLTSEHQEIVVENTKAALELLRNAMTIFVRVSSHDFNYLSSFKEQLISMIEARADLKFIEDPTVEPGGVYIETEMGDIDATIRTQLEELTSQMRFYMPVKVKTPPQKIREESSKQEVPVYKPDLQPIPKTPTASSESYNVTHDYTEPAPVIEDPVLVDSLAEPVPENTSSKETFEFPDNAESLDEANTPIEIVSDDEMNNDPLIQEALDSYKETIEEQPSHDEDLTV